MPIDPIERADQLAKQSPRELALLVVEVERDRDDANAKVERLSQQNVNLVADWTYERKRADGAVEELTSLYNSPLLAPEIIAAEQRAEVAEQQSAQLRSALAELVIALKWWMPDETLVEPHEASTYDEHIKLLQRIEALHTTGEPE